MKNAFRLKNGQVQLLMCTDAAGEGLNLQFAGAVVNYDLPWNPMKVEQRIGRIDRLGQKRAKIRVLNFAYRGTVEEHVFFTVGERINLVQALWDDCDQSCRDCRNRSRRSR